LAYVRQLATGNKLVVMEASLVNEGTATADVTATVMVPALESVDHVVGYSRLDMNNAGIVVTVSKPNSLVITAQSVPAGATTKVKVTTIGY